MGAISTKAKIATLLRESTYLSS